MNIDPSLIRIEALSLPDDLAKAKFSAELKSGDIIKAKVLRVLPDSTVKINLAGFEVTVSMEEPLPAGTELTLQVREAGKRLLLETLARAFPPEAQSEAAIQNAVPEIPKETGPHFTSRALVAEQTILAAEFSPADLENAIREFEFRLSQKLPQTQTEQHIKASGHSLPVEEARILISWENENRLEIKNTPPSPVMPLDKEFFLSDKQAGDILARLSIPDNAVNREILKQFMQYGQPFNIDAWKGTLQSASQALDLMGRPMNTNDILQQIRQLLSGEMPGFKGTATLSTPAQQSAQVVFMSINAPALPNPAAQTAQTTRVGNADMISPELRQSIEAAVFARSASLPAKPEIIAGLRELLFQPVAWTTQFLEIEKIIQTLKENPEIAKVATPALNDTLNHLQSLRINLEKIPEAAGDILRFMTEFGLERLQSAIDSVESAAAKVLRADPTLDRINQLLRLLQEPGAESKTTVAADANVFSDISKLLGDNDFDESLRQLQNRVEMAKTNPAEREMLARLTAQLQTLESREIEGNPALRELQNLHSQIKTLADRAETLKTANFSPGAAQITVVEIPLRMNQDQSAARLKIYSKEPKEKYRRGDPVSIALSLDMDAIGEVDGRISAERGNLKIRFEVDDAGIRKLFEEAHTTLQSTLKQDGFDAVVETLVRKTQVPKRSFLREIAEKLNPGNIDLKV